MSAEPSVKDTDEPTADEPGSGETAAETVASDETAQDQAATPEGGESDDDGLGTQSEVENLGPCKIKVKAEVSKSKVEKMLDHNYRDLIGTIQLPGFRRGRVPRQLVEKRFGEEVEKEVKESLLNDSFLEVIQERKLKIVGRPEFDEVHFEKGDDFRYDATVEIHPEFELKNYKKVEVKRESLPVTEEDVAKELEDLRKRNASLVPIELKESGNEDVIIASYRYLKGGADGEELLRVDEASFKPVDGFLDELAIPELKDVFAKRGDSETLSVETKIPDNDPREALRGENVVVEITLKDAKRIELPELDEEFAKSLQVEGIEELKKLIEENLKERQKHNEETKMENEILEKIEGSVEFDVPEGLFEEQKRAHKMKLQYELLQQGRSKEEIEDELKKREAPDEDSIRKEIRQLFILEKIAEQEKIFATEDDVKKHAFLLAQVYGRNPTELLRELEQAGKLDEMRLEIRQRKVKKFLVEKAKVLGDNGNSAKKEDSKDEPSAEKATEKD